MKDKEVAIIYFATSYFYIILTVAVVFEMAVYSLATFCVL